MAYVRNVNKILVRTPEQGRHCRRSRCRLEDNIKENLNKQNGKGISLVQRTLYIREYRTLSILYMHTLHIVYYTCVHYIFCVLIFHFVAYLRTFHLLAHTHLLLHPLKTSLTNILNNSTKNCAWYKGNIVGNSLEQG
jgi:hypothetical protein